MWVGGFNAVWFRKKYPSAHCIMVAVRACCGSVASASRSKEVSDHFSMNEMKDGSPNRAVWKEDLQGDVHCKER